MKLHMSVLLVTAALAAPAAAADAPWFLPYAQICSTANHQQARVAVDCRPDGAQPQVQAPNQQPANPGTCQTDVVFPGYNLRFRWPVAGDKSHCLCLDESGKTPQWVSYLQMSARAGPDGWLDRDALDLGAAGKCFTNGAVAGSKR
ncbi:hypothetical protein ACFOGJ_17310 [Marinibaculum pumilum]|uniref:Secreted protein n=1 Tax=Marinibaculum pumilum TaxID=1766165 RepID=A0ABV7L405_9PROT